MRLVKADNFLIPSLVIFVGFMAYSSHWFGEAIHRKYDSRPPELAFKEAFHRPVPADVRALVAAGESSLGGSNVWLRFQASPETIRMLTAGAAQVAPWKRDEGMANEPSLLIRYNVPDRLGWRSVWTLSKGDYLEQGTPEHYIQIAVDRKTSTVYAFYYSI